MNSIEDLQHLMENNQYEEVEKLARKLLEEAPNDLDIKTILAKTLIIQEKNSDATPLLEDIIKCDDQNYYPLYLLGVIKEQQEDFNQAIEYYNRALEKKPNDGKIYFRLGTIHINNKFKDKDDQYAIRYLRNAVTSDNPPSQAFIALASIEPLSRAVYVLQNGLSKYPTDEYLNNVLCEKYYSLKEYAKCIEAVNNAHMHNTSSDYIEAYKVLSLFKLKRFKEALDEIQHLKDLDERLEIVAKAFEGLLLCEVGEYEKAESTLEKLIADDVGNHLDFIGHILLAYCYIKDSKLERAEKVFNDISLDSFFTPPIFLYFFTFLEVDEYFLALVDELILKGKASKNRAKYLRLVHSYVPGIYEDIHTIEELERFRVGFLEATSLLETRKFEAYEFLYFVSLDLKDWGEAANYYFLSYIHNTKHHYLGDLDKNILENIIRNKKSVEKLFSSIDQVLESFNYYVYRFAENCLSPLITFFHSKERFDLVVRLAEKFSYSHILKAECVFEVAYAYKNINNAKQAKIYYRAYLRDIGENSAVANNLAIIEEEDGNLAEAERLLQLALKLDAGNERAKNNHGRVLARIHDEEEKKRAYQKATDLYRQEPDNLRLLATKLYSLKNEDELILYSNTALSSITNLNTDEIEYQVEEFLKKKYFDEISSKSIQFDGRILRANPAITSLLENDLRKFNELDMLRATSIELLSENLGTKYGYNQLLLDKLSIINSAELSKMLERDLYETVVALAIKSYKSALILCGSIAESVLLDAMLAQKDNAIKGLERILAKENKSLKGDDTKLDRWVLDRLLDVALEINKRKPISLGTWITRI